VLRQLPRVVVCGAGAAAIGGVALGIAAGVATEGVLTLGGGAIAVGAAVGGGDVAVGAAVGRGAAATCAAAGAGCAAVPEPRFATATVPAIVKNEATLSPPRSQRVAAAG
jgi:hypothetical protein